MDFENQNPNGTNAPFQQNYFMNQQSQQYQLNYQNPTNNQPCFQQIQNYQQQSFPSQQYQQQPFLQEGQNIMQQNQFQQPFFQQQLFVQEQQLQQQQQQLQQQQSPFQFSTMQQQSPIQFPIQQPQYAQLITQNVLETRDEEDQDFDPNQVEESSGSEDIEDEEEEMQDEDPFNDPNFDLQEYLKVRDTL